MDGVTSTIMVGELFNVFDEDLSVLIDIEKVVTNVDVVVELVVVGLTPIVVNANGWPSK